MSVAMSGNEAADTRLAAFDQRKDEILCHLQHVGKSKTGSFGPDTAWRELRSYAWRYLTREAQAKERRVPFAVRIARLRHLENALREARCALDEIGRNEYGSLFGSWSYETYGNSDFTDPITSQYENSFYKLFKEGTAGLADLAITASRVADHLQQHKKPGPLPGKSSRQIELIIGLNRVYRRMTGKPGAGGRGVFAQFVVEFLAALGCKTKLESAVKIIGMAKKDPRWGVGKIPPK
jgi:hypothetical protein